MTEPPASGAPVSSESRSRRKQELGAGILPPKFDENAEEMPVQPLAEMARAAAHPPAGEDEEGPLSRRLDTHWMNEQGWGAGGAEAMDVPADPLGPPRSSPSGSSLDLRRSRHPSISPVSDGSISRRWGDVPLLSGGPTSRRYSDPPPSGPVSARAQGVMSEGPISEAPLSLRVARVSGDAGPGYRIVEGKEGIWAKLDGPDAEPCPVVRLSLAALWLVSEKATEYSLHAPVRITLIGKNHQIGPLLAQIVAIHPETSEEPPLIGLQLVGVSLSIGRQILDLVHSLLREGTIEPARSLVMSREHIDAPERVSALVAMLLYEGIEGMLQGSNSVVRALRIEKGEPGKIAWTSNGNWGTPPYAIEMVGYNSIHRFSFPSVQFEADGTAITPLPTYIERIRHRGFRRVLVRTPISVQFRHPLWPELSLPRRKVRDISYAGLSFEADRDEDLVFPGLEISEMIVEVAGGATIRLRGQIRYVAQPKQKGELSLCGVQVSPRSVVDEPLWVQLVSEELHGTLKSGIGAPEPVWHLFESSGYFQLSGKTPDQFEPLKSSFITVGRRAGNAPQIMWQVAWPSQRGVEASISLLKAYHGTWMVHQLAKRPGRAPGIADSRQILRDIYLRALEHPQIDADFRWMMAFVDTTVPWSRMCHLDFGTRHEATGLSYVRPFRLMEASSAEPIVPAPGRYRVGKATLDEEERLIEHVHRARSYPFAEALDFAPDFVELGGVSRLWRSVGFERERTILAARLYGEPIAVAVVESGESGTNLFRLLDSVRLFALRPEGKEAYAELLEAARHWYLEKGKHAFVYLHEHEDEEALQGTKFRSLGEGGFWVIHALLLPDFLEHVYEMTAPRKKT